MPLYGYRCASGHLTELIRPMGTDALACPECGSEAQRQTVYRSSFVVDPAEVPEDQRQYDLRLFREASAERAYYHAREEDRAQRDLPAPSLWKQARRQASQVRAGRAPAPSGRR